MERKKAHNISVVLGGIGVMLILLPAFDLFRDNQDGFLFAGIFFILRAILIRMLAKE